MTLKTQLNRFPAYISFTVAIFFIFSFSGCKKYRDPNVAFYKYLAPNLEEKPYYFEKRRVNLNSNTLLETLLIYKLRKESEWKMAVLKEKAESKTLEKVVEEKLADPEDLLDRLIVRDFFREGFNSISLEFRAIAPGTEEGVKKFLVFRLPSMLEINRRIDSGKSRALFSLAANYKIKETAHVAPSLQDASQDKKPDKKEEDSPIFWEDTNEDGQMEIVLAGRETDEKKGAGEKEYAYSRQNKYKNARIFKYNGLEFQPFDIDHPFLYYKEISLPQNMKRGESGEVVFKMTNLGTYTPKAYVTLSFPQGITSKILSLKNIGRNYDAGSRIFHLKKKDYISARHPLVEYSIFPWANKRSYTFKMQVLVPKNLKDDKLVILQRSSLEARGRSIFTPSVPEKESAEKAAFPQEFDQQGFPAYQFKISVIP